MIEQLQQQSIIKLEKLIICGDFNYSHLRPNLLSSSTAEN
jgi:hypothetical protein